MKGFPDLLAGKVEFICRLQIHPEIGRHSEILPEAKGRIRRYAPLASEKLIEAVGRHFENFGKLFGGQAGFLQFISENLAGVDRRAGHDLQSQHSTSKASL